ncbi:MAG: hypothetical protein M0Q26_05960 [Chitinophagaceae bacterium]|nr:hypothetical protein [Chitinophagaceae bacterium]MDP1763428.1 hypothetical protein [Sediminibacterium sp.]
MFNQSDIAALNANIEQWNDETVSQVRDSIDGLNIKRYRYSQNPRPLINAFRSKLRKDFELVNRISYSMPRSAIFLHKGVSRGHGKNNPRQAKEWLMPVIDSRMDALGDIVADGQGDLVINALTIK